MWSSAVWAGSVNGCPPPGRSLWNRCGGVLPLQRGSRSVAVYAFTSTSGTPGNVWLNLPNLSVKRIAFLRSRATTLSPTGSTERMFEQRHEENPLLLPCPQICRRAKLFRYLCRCGKEVFEFPPAMLSSQQETSHSTRWRWRLMEPVCYVFYLHGWVFAPTRMSETNLLLRL